MTALSHLNRQMIGMIEANFAGIKARAEKGLPEIQGATRRHPTNYGRTLPGFFELPRRFLPVSTMPPSTSF